MYLDYRDENDFIGMDMCRKFLEMGFTRARRYANHNTGRKYKKGTREILPQEPDHATSKYAQSATIFKKVRDIVAKNEIYVTMRKEWRKSEWLALLVLWLIQEKPIVDFIKEILPYQNFEIRSKLRLGNALSQTLDN